MSTKYIACINPNTVFLLQSAKYKVFINIEILQYNITGRKIQLS